jgi:hypothetical protein
MELVKKDRYELGDQVTVACCGCSHCADAGGYLNAQFMGYIDDNTCEIMRYFPVGGFATVNVSDIIGTYGNVRA